ncbi:hypothetical protein WMF30_37665 [Sorangium sp. So ce134]
MPARKCVRAGDRATELRATSHRSVEEAAERRGAAQRPARGGSAQACVPRLAEKLSPSKAKKRRADFDALEPRALVFYAADLAVDAPWTSAQKERRAALAHVPAGLAALDMARHGPRKQGTMGTCR